MWYNKKAMKTIFRQKWLIVALSLILVMVLVALCVIKTFKNSYLNLYVAPVSATVTIDGRQYKNGTYAFYEGKHTAIITKDGLEKKEITFYLGPDHYTNLFTYLTGQNNDFSYYLGNPDDFAILKEISDENSQSFVDQVIKSKGIYDLLPASIYDGDNLVASVYKNSECGELPCIRVVNMIGDNHEDKVKDFILQNGYNPDFYSVDYVRLSEEDPAQ